MLKSDMPFRIRISLAILLALILTALLGPLLIPVPTLKDTVPAIQLADPDSQFIEVGELTVHFKTSSLPPLARGPVLVFLHGFASSLYSWHEVLEILGRDGWSVAFDRPAFGLTERPRRGEWRDLNPYAPEGQLRVTLELLNALEIGRAVLVGHSSGGALAVKLALESPDRVAALVLVDPAIVREGGPPRWSRPLLFIPQLNRVGPLLMRQFSGSSGWTFLQAAWSDPRLIDDETFEAYRRALQVDDWDWALWEYSRSTYRLNLVPRLSELSLPTLVVSGADDEIVPLERTKEVAQAIPNATLAVFDSCGHVPHEECPLPFIEVVKGWLLDQGFFN